MKKKVMLASLLAIGLAAGVGTQIHAQDTACLLYTSDAADEVVPV